jgi:hypothetical protein
VSHHGPRIDSLLEQAKALDAERDEERRMHCAEIARVQVERDRLRVALAYVRGAIDGYDGVFDVADDIIVGRCDAMRMFDDDDSRCAVCGWPLTTDIKDGCVRGNCSQRPRPERLYAPERAAKERP